MATRSHSTYGRFARYYDIIYHNLVNYEGDVDLCMFGAFGYTLPRRDAVRVLRSVRAHISPSGLFIFEFWQSSAARPAPHQSWVHIRKPDFEIVRLDESRLRPANGTAARRIPVLRLPRPTPPRSV